MSETITVKPIPDRRSRRKQLLVALLLLVLAVLLLPKLLFGGGDDASEVDLFPSTAPPADTTDTTDTTESGVGPSGLEPGPTPSGSPAGKNPFEPLMAMGVAPGGAGGSADDSIVPPEPELPPDLEQLFPSEPEPNPVFLPPSDAPATSPNVPPVPPPAPRVERTFGLVEIYIDGTGLEAATVRIDDTSHDVAVGQEFADHYRVLGLDVDDECGVFVYGTRRFSLCVGEERIT